MVALDKITAVFGLVSTLTWNAAIMTIFKEIFEEADRIVPLVICAIIITIAASYHDNSGCKSVV